MKTITTILLGILLLANSQFIEAQNFYLHPNGVTCMCPNAAVGESGVVNGVTYTKRTKEQITQQNAATTCTSGITNMVGLFSFSNTSFNGDISSWDVSNVTDMTIMFSNSEFNQPINDWDVSNVTTMFEMFSNSQFNQPIANWDVSNVTNISGMFSNSKFNQSIGNWDVSNVTNMSDMFCSSQFNKPIGNWDVSNVTNMSDMFYYSQFNQPIGNWDVSNVSNMTNMFINSPFNQPIGDWDVSNVTNMRVMFAQTPFNQPIGDWDVSNVSNMSNMFSNSQFNQPIGDWDVSNVTDMAGLFAGSLYNQTINEWDVSNVTDMSYMFKGSSFNQPIGSWDVSNVTNMKQMFSSTSFNQNIGNWDVSNVTDMSGMFYTTQFNQPIDNWDVSNVTDMSKMFEESSFNQPIGGWDVSNVTDMCLMFYGSLFNQPIINWNVTDVTIMSGMFGLSQFNQSIENWDVSAVTDMSALFYSSQFNQPIDNWDVSAVTDMSYMFFESQFNQPIGNWDVSNVTYMKYMFYFSVNFNQDISTWSFKPSVIFASDNSGFIFESNFSKENYDLLLQSFSDQNLQNKNFPAMGLFYCNTSARNDLINNKGWSITGDASYPTSILAPVNITLNTDQESCFASNVDLGFPTVQSCLSYEITSNAPAIFPIGETQILWTITDSDGVTDIDYQEVTVAIDVDEASVCYVSSDDIETSKNRIFINNLDWNNVVHYEVYRESNTNDFQTIGILTQGESSFLDSTSNNASQTYRYRVRTLDICDNFSSFSTIHRTILLQSSISVNNTVNLSWINYEGISFDSYKIYRKINSGDFELIANVSSNTSVYTDTQANISLSKYEYYVAIEVQPCDTGNKFSSVEIKSNKAFIGVGGILDDFQENQVVIHPNPILNILNITIPDNVTLSSCTIYNTLGQKVMTSNTTSFSVEHLPPSTYYINITTSAGDATKPFIKIDSK